MLEAETICRGRYTTDSRKIQFLERKTDKMYRSMFMALSM